MIISPSILSADFSRLKESIDEVKDYVEAIHIDVMDGVFVPNISIGIPVIKAIRKHYKHTFDVHLMIIDPLKYINDFVDAGSDIITIHFESQSNILETIKKIRSCNIKAGLSIKPNTKVEEIKKYLEHLDLVLVMSVEPGFGGQKFIESSLEKIKELSTLKKDCNYKYIIEVDGGINDVTARQVKQSGCEMLVAGSYIFDSLNKLEAILKLKE